MKVTVCAVGRLRKGPELDLISDYLERFSKAGRSYGLGPASVVEVEDKKNLGMEAEAVLLERAIPAGAVLVTLDERGDLVTSPEFAAKLAGWRDAGRDLAFVIGGADGIAPALRAKADWSLSFGKMVWPHMLVRVMLAEQLYRAGQILAGTPYHRA
ncbi:23S rRNA (pseudouridine(1915)-N(3))-methyltransferase RlmH [Sinirhodobacter ferrireducens]|uniref:Ribosomal RNA large subunit methyltransferase H n=1 Tax=Paenirhodobacter ferrireducens TaxID=1215032 RepID=A0A443LDR4_9RHOB|nr:23S rRNA (pseudouridine(1915)-N(3))-methyltransferase RlmH [Sinirhodobacter ferrireducens]RWR47245.1 23S rRNA (pseudouridine(1915)-N(3))-methyltransferase RlmH [Sinirhodobacter ferrireducens]